MTEKEIKSLYLNLRKSKPNVTNPELCTEISQITGLDYIAIINILRDLQEYKANTNSNSEPIKPGEDEVKLVLGTKTPSEPRKPGVDLEV